MADRRSTRAPRTQLPSLMPLIVLWTVAGAGLVAVAAQTRVPLDRLFLDAAHLSDQPWYTGIISELGVLAWATGVVAAVGGAWVAAQTGRPSAARFLRSAAVVGAVLLVADLLQLHVLAFHVLGVPKVVGQALVIAPAAVWLVRERVEVRRTRWLFLAAAGVGMAVSVVADLVLDADVPVALFAEDGAKLLGILAWAQYLVLTSVDITRSTIRAATAGPEVAGPDPREGPGEPPVRGGNAQPAEAGAPVGDPACGRAWV